MTVRAEWIDALGREHVLEVARALGLEVQAPRGSSGGACSCPGCGAVKRHPSRGDRRLAVGVRAEGRGWRCYECDAHGDQLHLVAVALERRRWDELDGESKSRVRAWVIEWLRLGQSPSSTPARPPRLELPAATDAPEYPPIDEVSALWERCVPVSRDARAVEWLHRRCLSARVLDRLGVCRVLPYGAPCPAWAGRPALEATEDKPARPFKPWSESAYRCVFGLYDSEGVMRSVLARYVGTPPERRERKQVALKSRAAHGFQRRGLVLADAPGVQMLRGELARGDAALSALRVVVGEGEMDLCSWATDAHVHPKRDELRATIAVVAGSWTPGLAARIPDGATVVIATHVDAGGERYAKDIEGTLAERIRSGAIVAKRWRP